MKRTFLKKIKNAEEIAPLLAVAMMLLVMVAADVSSTEIKLTCLKLQLLLDCIR